MEIIRIVGFKSSFHKILNWLCCSILARYFFLHSVVSEVQKSFPENLDVSYGYILDIAIKVKSYTLDNVSNKISSQYNFSSYLSTFQQTTVTQKWIF